MKILSKSLLVLGCCLMLAAPHLADAKAGGGRSSGSMGGRTHSAPSYSAQPIQRSVTPRPAVNPAPQPMAQPAPSMVPPMAQSSGHPFLYGLAGGFLGAGLSHMLFGNSFGAMGGVSPMGSGLGGIFQILLLVGLGYLVYRFFRNRSAGGPSPFSGFSSFTNNNNAQYDAPFNASTPTAAPMLAESPLTLTQADFQAFPVLLEKIQLAWGKADVAHLRPYLTPEMLQYFNEELSANTSQGEANIINNVVVTECSPLQSWSEADLDYATLRMKWRAVDYMVRLQCAPTDADYIVSGDATYPVDAEEIWTFARARSGGNWLLSAIQQVA